MLKYQRHRRDMIDTYKILHGIYDSVTSNCMITSSGAATRYISCQENT